MAHEFVILDINGEYTTYTEYDDIPQSKVLAVIKYKPDIEEGDDGGPITESFQLRLENDTFDSDMTDNIPYLATEGSIDDGNLIAETGDFLVQEISGDNIIVSMADQIQPTDAPIISPDSVVPVNIVLDGSDASGSNAGGKIAGEDVLIHGRHRLALENYPIDILVLEDAPDSRGFRQAEPAFSVEEKDLDLHTEEEHKEIALWQYRGFDLVESASANKDVFKTLILK